MASTLAEYVRQGRNAKKMTQVGLRKATGLAQTYISEIERGNRRPSEDVCMRVATALGLNYKIMLELRQKLPPSPDRTSPGEMQLLKAIRTGKRKEAEAIFNAMLP